MLGPSGRQLASAATAVAVASLLLGGLGCGLGAAGGDPTLTPTATRTATATATTTPIPTPTPKPDPLVLDAVSPGLQELRARLEAEISGYTARVGGNFAVAVTDLQTGETVDINGDDAERIPGCTMNLFVLLLVAQDLQAGLYPEHEVGRFIAQTVWASDPGTGHYLLRKSGAGNSYAGLWKVNDVIRNQLGLASAVYDHPPANDVFTLVPGEWHENRISPLDFNRALTMLYRGEVLSPEWTAYLIDKMSRVKPGLNHLIPAGVGDPTAVVAHKNGYIDYVPYYVDNDVGIVIFQRGEQRYAYALTFWSQDNPWVLSDAPLGQTVSRLVWDYFSATYR
jgi:beta-lactamase class A